MSSGISKLRGIDLLSGHHAYYSVFSCVTCDGPALTFDNSANSPALRNRHEPGLAGFRFALRQTGRFQDIEVTIALPWGC